ncbi:MAG: hypothetical protein AB7L94_01830 [Kofleriaceae bacterium]
MTRTRQLILVLCLATASGIFAPGCVVRGRARVGVTTTPVVYEAPPEPKAEVVTVNEGHVWVRGRWDWRNGAWQWQPGHWERQRAGSVWTDGRWERRGNSWHWVDGTWQVSSTTTVTNTPTGTPGRDVSNASGGVVVSDTPRGGGPPPHAHDRTPPPSGTPGRDVSNASGGVVVSDTPRGGGMYPTAAPPPPRTDNQGSAPGANYIWVRGRWNWINANWEWVPGHWERKRANSTWVDGRWELQGNYYVWVEGRWDKR